MDRERPGDWTRYWRSADGQVEAMHAGFHGHVYHRHSHDTYSLGVTESGPRSPSGTRPASRRTGSARARPC